MKDVLFEELRYTFFMHRLSQMKDSQIITDRKAYYCPFDTDDPRIKTISVIICEKEPHGTPACWQAGVL